MADSSDPSDPFNRLPKPPRPNDHTNTIAPPTDAGLEHDAGLEQNPWTHDEHVVQHGQRD